MSKHVPYASCLVPCALPTYTMYKIQNILANPPIHIASC